MTHKLAFIGFGGVGQGLLDILRTKGEWLDATAGTAFEVVAISDLKKGSIYDPEGLDLNTIHNIMQTSGNLEDYPTTQTINKRWTSLQTIESSNADTIIEITFTDVKTGQPAIDHCKAAFQSGKNVVMSNKGPVALAYDELSAMAHDNNVHWGFEGTVMSGTPAIRMPLVSLTGNHIREIRGIFNGTTNYILTEMEQCISYEEALEKAQKLGYAEADPTSDVEGYDALYKIVILANVILGIPLKRETVERIGISNLTIDDIEQARKEKKRWKLLGTITNENGTVKASVKPEKLPFDDPLAGVSGPTNALTYDCDLSGEITLMGPGAGLIETGYSLLIDLINIERGQLTAAKASS